MSAVENTDHVFEQEDHQGCYIFNPNGEATQHERPSKRRKVSKKDRPDATSRELALSTFAPLLNGKERADFVSARERLFIESWSRIDEQVQRILRESNQATLDQVSAFMRGDGSGSVVEAYAAGLLEDSGAKIPSAFIITGANIASQDLLFEQLSESLQSSSKSRFVRLRSADAGNVKAALKKIIRDVTARLSDDDDAEVTVGRDGRRYLDYDLAGLHAFIEPLGCENVFIAIEDSEAFDGGLLSDLILLFSSWRSRIPFALLFGVATSVELLQARLLRAAIPCIHGAQFDVAQSSAILERIFKCTVAGTDVTLTVGPALLQSLVDRQRDQVAGIHEFISSIKYAYMCHFYASPLSALLELGTSGPQTEHVQALRTLPSFRHHVEALVERGDLDAARSLLTDDNFVTNELQNLSSSRRQWLNKLLQCLQIIRLTGALTEDYPQNFINALVDGISLEAENNATVKALHRMQAEELITFIEQLVSAIKNGDSALGLPGYIAESETLFPAAEKLIKEARAVKARADDKGNPLRSAYSGQNKVLRTTVVAQKVQLSRDSATLTDEDKEFTAIVDELVRELTAFLDCGPATDNLWHELWLYDSRSPHREVFVPRPRAVVDRSLLRPHDYLGCSCCATAQGGLASTLPPTALLYQLYLETGGLINVADLWSAFLGLVGDGGSGSGTGDGGKKGKKAKKNGAGDGDGGGCDERTALVLFYRALADLRMLGFVKASRKKEDHVAKLKWL